MARAWAGIPAKEGRWKGDLEPPGKEGMVAFGLLSRAQLGTWPHGLVASQGCSREVS